MSDPVLRWRKSTYSGSNGACVEIAVLPWRKSTCSSSNGACVEIAVLPWRKSTHSTSNGQCVEIADLGQHVAVRNSNRPDAGTLTFSASAMRAFIDTCKTGRLDHLGK